MSRSLFFFWSMLIKLLPTLHVRTIFALGSPVNPAACPVLLDVLTNCLGPGRASTRILNLGRPTRPWPRPPVTCRLGVWLATRGNRGTHQLPLCAQQSQGGP